ncbi:MAG TPA: dihydrofolate reductase family protein [Stenotrophomonas sp.]
MSMSLDGFVCGPNGEVDRLFRTMGDPVGREWVASTLREAGAHVMGSGAYYEMAAFWPYSDLPMAAPMNQVPKIVFSNTGLRRSGAAHPTQAPAEPAAESSVGMRGAQPAGEVLRSWSEPTVVSGDLAEQLLRLKQQPGGFLLAHGGARFARSLVATGLIDEYRLVVHPIALGAGQALFSGLASPVDLKLASTTSFASGVVAAVYHPITGSG